MSKKARNYTSDILDELLSEITPEEQRKTDKRMLLAAKIDDAMKAKGWRKGDLAREMQKQPSVITRWLSGTHNFETDTLFELEDKLGINLVNIGEKRNEQVLHFHLNLTQKVNTNERSGNAEPKLSYPYASWEVCNPGMC
jgi:ribosome-binding protein aMBF1 (putative translation factor)